MEEYEKITNQTLKEDERNEGNANKEKKTNQGFNIWAAIFGFFYYIYNRLPLRFLSFSHSFLPRESVNLTMTGDRLSKPVSLKVFPPLVSSGLLFLIESITFLWIRVPFSQRKTSHHIEPLILRDFCLPVY